MVHRVSHIQAPENIEERDWDWREDYMNYNVEALAK